MIKVKLTRETDKTLSLAKRSQLANSWGANYFISIHTNAGGGKGAETFHSRNGEKGTIYHAEAKRVAELVQSELVKATGLTNRGIKTRLVTDKNSSLYGLDYYSVIRQTHCPALLVEAGFHDNPAEEALLKTPEFRQKIAEGVAAGIRKANITGLIVIDPGHGGNDRANRGPTEYIEADGVLDISLRLRDILDTGGTGQLYTVKPGDTMTKIASKFGITLQALIAANPQVENPNLIYPGQVLNIPTKGEEPAPKPEPPAQGTPILGPPQATVTQAQEWAKKRGAHQRFIGIASVYWKYGEITGIRPEVLYAQSAKETAFGRYGGAVTPDQNNWCGVKTKNATGDKPEDHETFPTPEEGVRAHFNHLAAYVGLNPIGEPHGRYLLVKSLPWAGTVRTVEELGGKWAPNPDYGNSIVRDYLNRLLATEAPPEEGKTELEQLRKENQELQQKLSETIREMEALRDKLNQIRAIIFS